MTATCGFTPNLLRLGRSCDLQPPQCDTSTAIITRRTLTNRHFPISSVRFSDSYEPETACRVVGRPENPVRRDIAVNGAMIARPQWRPSRHQPCGSAGNALPLPYRASDRTRTDAVTASAVPRTDRTRCRRRKVRPRRSRRSLTAAAASLVSSCAQRPLASIRRTSAA